MMQATVAIMRWRTGDAEVRARGVVRSLEAGGMRRIVQDDGWIVLVGGGTPVQASGHDLLIGNWHGSAGTQPFTYASAPPATRAGRLVRDGWGAYIVVIVDGGTLHVMTDPSGAIPAWMLHASGLTLVSDHLTPDLARQSGLSPTIDRAALSAILLDPASATHQRPLSDVKALIPGELHDLDAQGGKPLWRPEHHASTHGDPAGSLEAAVDLATETLVQPRTLIQLSGGLDSAIVLGTLAAHGHRPLAMNVATCDVAGDERPHARASANAAGCRLIEIADAAPPDYRSVARAIQVASPFSFGLDDAFERAVDVIAFEHEATIVMTGQGGDAVFFQPPTPLVSVDLCREKGFGRHFWRSLPDAALRTRTSIWPHVGAAFKDRIGTSSVPMELLGSGLLTPEALSEGLMVDRLHPWARNAKHLPPGKQMQIVMIANSQIFHSRRPTGITPLRHPLLTQPVLEASLAIPTFTLSAGRTDRGLARSVFAKRIPPSILHRRTKGDASDHYSRAVLANLAFMRDFLLEGQLCAMGVLDRTALDALLTPEALFFSLDYRGLAMQVSCEAWVRAWQW